MPIKIDQPICYPRFLGLCVLAPLLAMLLWGLVSCGGDDDPVDPGDGGDDGSGSDPGFHEELTFSGTDGGHLEVAEVSVDQDGTVHVHRVVCAVDCGTVINPDMVVAQLEGGIAFGLTAALKAAITVENGRAQQSNFHDYPLLQMDEMPLVEVYIVPSDERPTGIGEMGVPPIAPAVANAVFAATGKRVRLIPIRPEDLRAA